MIFPQVLRGCFLASLALLPVAVNTSPAGRTEDPEQSLPPVVDPGPVCVQSEGKPAPSDAIVLFSGMDLSGWRSATGEPAPWRTEDDYMEIVPGSGAIRTDQSFGDCQLHLEWRAPLPVTGSGQDRGNSGVYFMERYEVQVLDSYDNATYPDGQAAAVYGQYPPLANASRPPGEWQTYDVIFRRPHFSEDGALVRPATITLFHNGVLVQDHVELKGPTGQYPPEYQYHPDKLPLGLQDHASPVRYRNVWIRELN